MTAHILALCVSVRKTHPPVSLSRWNLSEVDRRSTVRYGQQKGSKLSTLSLEGRINYRGFHRLECPQSR